MALTVDIEKTCGAFHLDVSFRAEREVLALLGASGSGKSLTLKCIAGIERPDRGHIALDGRVLFDSERGICLPPQQRRVGYLFQQYALFPTMTAEQNISAGARHLSRDKRRQRVSELIAMLRLEDAAGKRPRQLSGGQQQRVALGRILAAEPEVILLDEPLSALDSYLKFQVELELEDLLSAFGKTAVWVSHDRSEAYRSCRRVCVLEGGRSSPVSDMDHLMQAPGTLSAARLFGYRNFVSVRPTEDPHVVAVPAWGGIRLRCAIPWQEGVTHLGLRAEHLHPAAPGDANAIPCRVERVVEDVSAAIVLLRPERSVPGAPLLHMELPKGLWSGAAALTVAAAPEQLLLLR